MVFGGITVLFWVLGMFFGIGFFMGGWGAFSFAYALHSLLSLAAFVLWILLMVKAYQGERFRVPIAADLAEKIFGKS